MIFFYLSNKHIIYINTNLINMHYTPTNIMVLDIETDGGHYIVQIAYRIYDSEFKFIYKKNLIINNGNYQNDLPIRDYFKKINPILFEKGITLEGALNIFGQDMAICEYLAGHNVVSADIRPILTGMDKYKIDYNSDKKILCTCSSSIDHLKLTNSSGKIKKPKLCELYKFLFSKEMNDDISHDATYDTKITAKCLKKLIKDNIIFVKDYYCKLSDINSPTLECQCGAIIKRSCISTHKKSNKHLKSLGLATLPLKIKVKVKLSPKKEESNTQPINNLLPILSEEQESVLEGIESSSNIIVDSVAGSGKTTTNLYIAKHFPNYKILLLTYNSKLKLETREKVKRLHLNNLETHSYHSFCVKYYDHTCFTDTELRIIVKKDFTPTKDFSYDLILLDEAQDITDLYYELVCKINKDNKTYAQFCLLGDKYQSIYAFNNADERYMTFGNELFDFNDKPWERISLNTSFRMTNQIADFVNYCMLNNKRIIADKQSEHKPEYIICDLFPDEFNSKYYTPLKIIRQLLTDGYSPFDIFILAPSLKSIKSPARLLENYLKTHESSIPIYVPTSDDEKLDSTVIKDKLIFSTFHQVKGLERKVVLVFGFDNSYFKYYKPDSNPLICPNELYVATTRAQERLFLFHNYSSDYLQFINKKLLHEYCQVKGFLSQNLDFSMSINIIDTQVTDITRHVPQNIIDECMEYLVIENIRPINKKILVPHKIQTESGYESISEINGIAIPSFFEYKKFGSTTILNYCVKPHPKMLNDPDNKLVKEFWEKNINKVKKIAEDGSDSIKENLLYISTIYGSLTSKYLFKSLQINEFNWLTPKVYKKTTKRLDSLNLTNKAQVEIPCYLSSTLKFAIPEILNRKICGRIDCQDGGNLFEFKCVEKLEKTHYLQLAIYMYVIEMNLLINNNLEEINYSMVGVERHYYLYNVLTDQLDEIHITLDRLRELIGFLFFHKYKTKDQITDQEFQLMTHNIGEKYK